MTAFITTGTNSPFTAATILYRGVPSTGAIVMRSTASPAAARMVSATSMVSLASTRNSSAATAWLLRRGSKPRRAAGSRLAQVSVDDDPYQDAEAYSGRGERDPLG